MRYASRFAALALLFVASAGCSEKPVPPPPWNPGVVYRAAAEDGPRGLFDLRGIIHAHSPYSHDACDGEPRDPVTDAIDETCFDDMRRAFCQTRHDFVMLTDHRDSFARVEYPDTLLYREALGDVLIERGGLPVANRITCVVDGEREHTLILAGTESGAMPVGLERHLVADPTERSSLYGNTEAATLERFKAAGAVVIAQHTEGWDDTELIDKPFDGFEMFNIHANLFLNIGKALTLIEQRGRPEELPHPELILLILISEDPTYLDRWSRVLAAGVHRTTTLGTDVHRNTFRDKLQDGERIDSYRRLMRMFSNHLLVRPASDGSFDDRQLKVALREGRLYGSFDYLGFPVGFETFAEVAGQPAGEMGETIPLAASSTLVVRAPRVQNLDPAATAPEITLRILRATDAGWVEEAASAVGDRVLRFSPTVPGAYRAEVRMRPLHLRGMLGDYEYLADEETFVWIYANPIYIE